MYVYAIVADKIHQSPDPETFTIQNGLVDIQTSLEDIQKSLNTFLEKQRDLNGILSWDRPGTEDMGDHHILQRAYVTFYNQNPSSSSVFELRIERWVVLTPKEI
jgi:hypothetical protein